MFKYIFSFKFGNIHPAGTTTTTSTTSNTFNAADKPVVKGGNDEGTVKESPLIQSVRQQRRQQLEEMALIRKIAHQSFMSQYAVDHLPLSQVQEKLEEDNLPLIQIQQKLKQTDDNLTVYTTTKENLRSLFYNQRRSNSLLMKPRKFRPTDRKDHHNNNNSNNNVDNNSNPTKPIKDDRDYDVWDDAVIGRIMNLVDTIGVEPGEAIQETHSPKESSTLSANLSGNAEEESDSKDRETIVAETVQEDRETQPVEAAEETTEYDEPDDHEESTGKRNATIIQVTTLTTTTSAARPDGLTRHSSYGGSVISIESDNRRESGFWKRNSILSPSSFFSNKEQNHSGFFGSDDDLIDRRSIVSVTSKASIDDFDDRDKKPIPFLKKLWKPKRQKDQTKETSSSRLMKVKTISSGSLSKKYYNQ